jgi:hypothetical protein
MVKYASIICSQSSYFSITGDFELADAAVGLS